MSKASSIKINVALLFLLLFTLIGYFLKFLPSQRNIYITIVGIIATIPVVIEALKAIKNKKVTVDLLASIALFVSILNKEWASVAFINLMITSARIFGDYTQNTADNAIKSLLKLRPEKVKIKTDDGLQIIPVEKVKIGDLVVVETGDRIPVDGKIIEGSGNIDESSLTGESIPATKIKGQDVLSSTLNLSGSFVMKTEKVGKDTTFEKIIALIQDAQTGKMGIQTSADRFASVYILITLAGSTILYLTTHNLNLILSVLLVACADDIAVAIPMAFWGAIAKAAKEGIIIKGGSFIEGLPKVKTLIVDKTGTLTKGSIKIQNIICFDNKKTYEALSLLASAESVSEHPIAKAITNHAQKDGIKFKTPTHFKEYAGEGIKAKVGKEKIVAGKLEFLEKQKIKIAKDKLEQVKQLEKEGYNVVCLGEGKELKAIFAVADEIRPDAKSTIYKLKNLGVKNVVMLTGDNEFVAQRVTKEVGLDSFHANLMPQDKLNYVRKYLSRDGKLAYIGDGVNDAASLKLADIGIAMGAIGSDAAIESADIALMQNNLGKVVTAFKMGNFVNRVAKENFAIWGIVNLAGLILVFSSVLGPQGAAVWNFVTDFFPIANSLRLLRYKTN